MREFLYSDSREITIIGIDEKIKNGYSHIASITHQMRSKKSHIQHASLLSQNSITYAGKSLRYRKNNPRDFIYSGKSGIEAILVDDIITTGSTITQAIDTVRQDSVSVEFVLVLADANY
jgi:competence protein ComFC